MSHFQPASAAVEDVDLPLVRLAQTGDLDAFDQLVQKHQSGVTALLFRFAPNRADLEDLVQEAFLHAWRGLPSWKPEKPFLHWLKRVSIRTALEFCRKRKRTPFHHLASPEQQPLENLPANATAAEAAQGAHEEAQFLLQQLPPEDRTLLTLLHMDEMPLAEIAEHFGWSKANAKIKAFRARNRLRAILERYGYSPT